MKVIKQVLTIVLLINCMNIFSRGGKGLKQSDFGKGFNPRHANSSRGSWSSRVSRENWIPWAEREAISRSGDAHDEESPLLMAAYTNLDLPALIEVLNRKNNDQAEIDAALYLTSFKHYNDTDPKREIQNQIIDYLLNIGANPVANLNDNPVLKATEFGSIISWLTIPSTLHIVVTKLDSNEELVTKLLNKVKPAELEKVRAELNDFIRFSRLEENQENRNLIIKLLENFLKEKNGEAS